MDTWLDKMSISILVCYFLREILYIYTTQKLVNKMMSRNYHDYQFSKNVGKTMVNDSPTLQESLRDDQDLAENLAPINSLIG